MENLTRIGKKLCLVGFTAVSALRFCYSAVMDEFLPVHLEIARLILSLLIYGLIPALALQWAARKLVKVVLPYRRAYLLTGGNLLLLYLIFKLPHLIQPRSIPALAVEAAAYLIATAAVYSGSIKREDGTAIGLGRGLVVVGVPAVVVVFTVGLGMLLIAFGVAGGIGGQM